MIRRWLTRFALSLTPVKDLLTKAGDVIREGRANARPSEMDALLAEEAIFQRHQLRTRMNEMLALREAEVACRNPEKFAELHEAGRIGTSTESVHEFKERLWELELALEDRGWVREVTMAALEFSRYGVQQLIRITRVYAIKNPLIKRGAEICRLYVFGRGIEIRCEDESEDEVIQAHLKANPVLSHISLGQTETSIQTDGALYWGLATAKDGTVTDHLIEPLEIQDVITDPDDSAKPLYFRRRWARMVINEATGAPIPTPMDCWYPSLELVNSGENIRADIASVPVNAEMPVYRVSAGGSPAKWRWPLPPLYGAIDWARAYKDFLEDWATVQRALARFSIIIQTKGGPGTIAAYDALLKTTFAEGGGTQIERNPPPVVGAAHTSGPDTKLEAFKSAGAQVAPEQARRLLLQTCAATGMPETFFGDASTGSLATAVSLDRPTELKFREIQQRWVETLTTILTYVLKVSVKSPGGKLREARANNPAPQPTVLVVKFPAVLEHDLLQMLDAWSRIAACGGRTGIAAGICDRRTILDGMLAEIGYENRSQLLDDIYGKNYNPAADVTDQRSQVPPQLLKTPTGKALTDLSIPPPLPPPPALAAPPTAAAKPAAAVEALARLTEAVDRIGARNGR